MTSIEVPDVREALQPVQRPEADIVVDTDTAAGIREASQLQEGREPVHVGYVQAVHVGDLLEPGQGGQGVVVDDDEVAEDVHHVVEPGE